MMTPAVMMSAAPAPSVMVTTAAAVHMAVAMPMSPDLDHRVILSGERRDSQPGGSRGGHRQRRSSAKPITTMRFIRFPPIA